MKLGVGFCLFATLWGSAALASTPVSVASGDWSNIPLVQQRGLARVSTNTIEQIEQAAVGECALPGQSKRQVDLTIPFMIKFSTAGAVEQVVVHRVDCPTIEQAVGSAVLTMANGGEYRPTGENREGWYRGDISFRSQQ